MTTAATTDLAEVLALVGKATPGEWQVFAPDDYEEGGCSLPTLGVESATGTAVVWYADSPQQGIENDSDAEAIASSVNYLRTQGDTLQRALALLAAVEEGETFGVWKPIETAPKTGRTMILLLPPSRFPQVAWSNTWWTAGFGVECKPTHWHAIEQVDAIDAARGEWG